MENSTSRKLSPKVRKRSHLKNSKNICNNKSGASGAAFVINCFLSHSSVYSFKTLVLMTTTTYGNFGIIAENYHLHRPRYPARIYNFLLDKFCPKSKDPLKILDIGCGTGTSTTSIQKVLTQRR